MKGKWLLIYNLPRRIGGWRWKERKVVFTTSRGGLEGGNGRKGKWLLIYNLPWRIGGWVWKERKLVANLQPPVED
jgi:hypothetical protein